VEAGTVPTPTLMDLKESRGSISTFVIQKFVTLVVQTSIIALYFAVRDVKNKKRSDTEKVKNGKISVLFVNRLNNAMIGSPTVLSPRDPACEARCKMVYMYKQKEWFESVAGVYDPKLGRRGRKIKSTKDIKHYLTPIGVFPHRRHGRLLLQNSVFTIHGGKCLNVRKDEKGNEKKDLIPLPEEGGDLEKLNNGLKNKKEEFLGGKCIIPYGAKPEIL